MDKLFISNVLHVHTPADHTRIKNILEGELSLAEHFVVLEKGSTWADKLNPGEEVQIVFGYLGSQAMTNAYAKVLATEKIPTEMITEGHARLNLGTTDLKTIIEKQFGDQNRFRVDFVSVLHLARKGGWKHNPAKKKDVGDPGERWLPIRWPWS